MDAEEELKKRLAGAASPATDGARRPEALPIDWSTEPRPVYANGVQVSHTPVDFAVLFTDMNHLPGRHAEGNEPGKERAVVTASLRMTPDVFFQMLCVLASNWNKFATELIDPRMRRPRFKLLDAGDMQLEGVPKKASEDD